MPVTINGSGSITGLAVGGLPDGSVDADTLASNAVTSAKIAANAVTNTEIADILTGGSVASGGAVNIGGIRVQYGTATTGSASNHGNASTYGYSCTYSANAAVSLSGFASEPLIVASCNTDYHEAKVAGVYSRSASGATVKVSASRSGGCASVVVHWVAIGDPS